MNTKAFTFGAAIGVVPGLAIAYYLYTHATWYQQYIDWQFAHPWVFVPAAGIGVAVAVLTDGDD